jgi:hypothetical protein
VLYFPLLLQIINAMKIHNMLIFEKGFKAVLKGKEKK